VTGGLLNAIGGARVIVGAMGTMGAGGAAGIIGDVEVAGTEDAVGGAKSAGKPGGDLGACGR
jgi:hypothetical protein